MEPALLPDSLCDIRITSCETLQHRAGGEMLFLEGERAAGIYILHSGEVDLLFLTREGEPRPLRVVTPGQILGLSSVVMARPHDCSAVTRTACEVGFIGRDTVLQSLNETPGTWLSVVRMLCNEVDAVYHDMRTRADLTRRNATGRVIAGIA